MWKEKQIVMLPTNDKTPKIGMISTKNTGELSLVDKELIDTYQFHQQFGDFAPAIHYQHLYILSDMEIKKIQIQIWVDATKSTNKLIDSKDAENLVKEIQKFIEDKGYYITPEMCGKNPSLFIYME